MTRAPSATEPAPGVGSAVEQLRVSVNHLFGAERRLRGRDHSRPGELTQGQMRSIAALGRDGELTAGQLAKSADLTPATVTAILDQLEAADIVARHRSTEDRRVCNIALTPKGWALRERKLAQWQSLWQDRLSGFTDTEIESAIRVIAQVTGILDSASPAPDSGAAPQDR
jgi:MarR family transcriptional regulator, organic hydroperoxide resistance regulator